MILDNKENILNNITQKIQSIFEKPECEDDDKHSFDG
jgi:hypothetical protein